jgi:hypothetical protein
LLVELIRFPGWFINYILASICKLVITLLARELGKVNPIFWFIYKSTLLIFLGFLGIKVVPNLLKLFCAGFKSGEKRRWQAAARAPWSFWCES